MDAEKRKLIVKEIGYWRNNRLLPEQYCDFLLNLYLENPAERPVSQSGMLMRAVRHSNWKIWFSITLLTAVFSYVFLNFTSFPLPMQIGCALLLVGVCYGAAYVQRKKRGNAGYLPAGAGSLSLLLIGIFIIRQHQMEGPIPLIAHLVLCGIVWLFVGIAMRMSILHLFGWIGMGVVYGALLLRAGVDGWGQLQIGWLPFCVLFVWLGWLLQHKAKEAGTAFLAAGALFWFAPEICGFAASVGNEPLLQLFFLAKIGVAGTILFLFRTKWIEWVV